MPWPVVRTLVPATVIPERTLSAAMLTTGPPTAPEMAAAGRTRVAVLPEGARTVSEPLPATACPSWRAVQRVGDLRQRHEQVGFAQIAFGADRAFEVEVRPHLGASSAATAMAHPGAVDRPRMVVG